MLPTPQFARRPPLRDAQSAKGGEMRNYRPRKGAAGIRRTFRNLTGRLNLATPRGNPLFWRHSPQLFNILYAKRPLPYAQMGKGKGKGDAAEQTKGAADRHGSPRNATETGGTPKFDNPALGARNMLAGFLRIM